MSLLIGRPCGGLCGVLIGAAGQLPVKHCPNVAGTLSSKSGRPGQHIHYVLLDMGRWLYLTVRAERPLTPCWVLMVGGL